MTRITSIRPPPSTTLFDFICTHLVPLIEADRPADLTTGIISLIITAENNLTAIVTFHIEQSEINSITIEPFDTYEQAALTKSRRAAAFADDGYIEVLGNLDPSKVN